MRSREKILSALDILFKYHTIRLDKMREWSDIHVFESAVLDGIEEILKEEGVEL